jgi:multidrug efflux pump
MIEQQITGVEGMLYMSSQSTNDGQYSLTVTFDVGVDLDMAQVLVQNRVRPGTPGVPGRRASNGCRGAEKVARNSAGNQSVFPDGSLDQLQLSNYATIRLKDEMARIPGVGDISMFGQQDYAMRVWLDPEKVAERKLTAADIVAALREQNVQVAAGSLARPPVPAGQAFNIHSVSGATAGCGGICRDHREHR